MNLFIQECRCGASEEPLEAGNVNSGTCPTFHFENEVAMIPLIIPEHGPDLSLNVRKSKSVFKGPDLCSAGRRKERGVGGGSQSSSY